MTPDQIAALQIELTRQQVSAAWIAAGAAAAQAAGAIAAIAYTGKLARDAANREAEAERRSAERAEAAERAAQQRIERAERDAINRPIQLVNDAFEPVIKDLDAEIARRREEIATHEGQIWAGFDSPNRVELARLVDRLRDSTTDPPLSIALDDLAAACAPWDLGYGVSWADFVDGLSDYRVRLFNAIVAVLRLAR